MPLCEIVSLFGFILRDLRVLRGGKNQSLHGLLGKTASSVERRGGHA